MGLLLSPRFWVAAVLVGLLSWSHLAAHRSGKESVQADWDKDIAARTLQVMQAEQAARKRERDLVEAKTKAEELYVKAKNDAAVAATGARSELGRLRDELAHAGGGGASKDPAAPGGVDGAPRLEQELLGQCAAAITDMAAEADRLAAVVVGLQSYIKAVCNP